MSNSRQGKAPCPGSLTTGFHGRRGKKNQRGGAGNGVGEENSSAEKRGVRRSGGTGPIVRNKLIRNRKKNAILST